MALDAATATTTTATTVIAEAAKVAPSPMSVSSGVISVYGFNVNLMAVVLAMIMLGVLYFAYQIQKSNKLDFADIITKDGRSVALTKVLQLIGGLTSTWIIIKLTLTGGLTEALFGLYLAYVCAIEGYSKFVAAKYGYK